MTAGNINATLDNHLRAGLAEVADPGNGETLSFEHRALAVVQITTAGAETRVLDSAANYSVGTRLLVVGRTLAGTATITGAAADVVLTTAGDCAEFIVSHNGTAKVWRLLNYSPGAGVALPVSAGTYEFLAEETAADAVAGILAILAALDSAGLIDASNITQAS